MAQETLTVGTPIIIPQDSPNGRYSAFFEDEGETGYFYAVDFSWSGHTIVDALHIYDVVNVVNRGRQSRVRVELVAGRNEVCTTHQRLSACSIRLFGQARLLPDKLSQLQESSGWQLGQIGSFVV